MTGGRAGGSDGDGESGTIRGVAGGCCRVSDFFLQLALMGVEMPIGAVQGYLRITGTFEGDAGENLRC